jgi:hypothetical protein
MMKSTFNPTNPRDLPTRPMTGRILRLAHGLGQGYIRAAAYRDVYFHRADTDGIFNKLSVGDEVTFTLLEDRFSGARAIEVRKKSAR